MNISVEDIKTPEDLENFLDVYNELKQQAAVLLQLKANLNGQGSIDDDRIWTEDWDFYAISSKYLGCGEYEERTFSISCDDVFDKTFEEKTKEQVKRQKEEEDRKKKQKEEEQKKAQEKWQYENYLKLKAKYEEEKNEKD